MSALTIHRKTITLTASGGAIGAELTGVTDVTKCVPLYTKRITTAASPQDNMQENAVDIYFTASPNKVWAETSDDTTRVIQVEVGVVECDGTDWEVSSGTYQITDTNLSTTANPGLTDMDNAFLIHTYQAGSGTGQDFRDAMTRGTVTSESVLTFDREESAGQIDGHWYTVESTDGSFAVQHETIALTGEQGTNTATINSVATNKTFLIGSWKGGFGDNCSDSCADIVLSNGTTITLTRESTTGSDELTWSGSAVTFAGSEVVLRGTMAAVTGTNDTDTLSSSIGTLANCTIHHPGNTGSLVHGLIDAAFSWGSEEAQVAWTLVDKDTARWDRSTFSDGTATLSYEVIEWDVGGAPPATRRVMVIS